MVVLEGFVWEKERDHAVDVVVFLAKDERDAAERREEKARGLMDCMIILRLDRCVYWFL